ncbi:MAG: HEAT repeat domain-containing protein [Aridibacter sp.]
MNEVDKAVLKAFKLAGNKLKKPVTINRLLQFIPKTIMKTLERTYGSYFRSKLYKVVNKLKNKELILCCGKAGKESFYIHSDYDKFKDIKLPVPQGERILKVFTEAVDFYKRPIAFNELKHFAGEKLSEEDLKNAARILSQLADMGKILKLSKVTGVVNSRNVYSLPNKQFNKDFEIPVTTQSHAVKKSFDVLWKHNCQKAQTTGELPRPVLTKQLRKYVWKHYSNILGKKKILDSVLLSLKHYENPFMRKVEREEFYFNAWAPHDSTDKQLNLENFYGNNYEKISVAVKRAVEKLERPVNAVEIKKEMKLDPFLSLDIAMSFNAFLSSAAKNTAKSKKKCVRRVGQHLDSTYYLFGDEKEATGALFYVLFLNSKLKFKQGKFKRRLEEIENCKIPTVAYGRLLLIKEETNELKLQFENILSAEKKIFSENATRKSNRLAKQLNSLYSIADELISGIDKSALPEVVDRKITTVSAEELLPILRPVYPAAEGVSDPNKLVRLLQDKIIRVENPEFINRFSSNSEEASRYFYDLTDALLKTAVKRGGYEASFQATLAINEMGRLRDERFIIPALESKDFEKRLTAIACLAFLGTENSVRILQKIMFEDHDPSVRKSAIWAYAFAKKTKFSSTIKKFIKSENNLEVKEFASMIEVLDFEDMWRV